MATIQKFYMHDAATTDTGTLPGSTATVSATTPVSINDGTNHSADGTAGTLQTSKAFSTAASTSADPILIARFCSAPIAAQTITATTLTLAYARAESNTSSNFRIGAAVAVWRPGTGALVGRIVDTAGNLNSGTENSSASTEQSDQELLTPSSVTAQSGDILVFEWWRESTAQAMATSYTNTLYYDGTVDPPTGNTTMSSAATYVDMGVAITMASGPQSLTRTTTDAPTTSESAARTATLLRTDTDAPTTAESNNWVGSLSRFGINPPH